MGSNLVAATETSDIGSVSSKEILNYSVQIHSKTRTCHDKSIQFDYCTFENGPTLWMINRSNGSDFLDFAKSHF